MTKEKFRENIEDILLWAEAGKYTFNKTLGLKYLDCGVEPNIFMDFQYIGKDEHRNPYGGIHGGIISSLIDTATGTATAAYTGKYVTTTDMSVSFLRALFGKNFTIHVEFTHIGSKMASAIVKMYDSDKNELCATGQLNFMQLDYKPRGVAV